MTDATSVDDYQAGPDGPCPQRCHSGHVYRYESWSARYPYRYTHQNGRSLLGYLRMVKATPDPVRCFFCTDTKKGVAA